jgi:hypothetical protein
MRSTCDGLTRVLCDHEVLSPIEHAVRSLSAGARSSPEAINAHYSRPASVGLALTRFDRDVKRI